MRIGKELYKLINYGTINRVFLEKIGVGMKRQKRYLFISVLMVSLFLSGCGTQLYEMTQEEEELIVHSAAYFVAKHNIRQKDGVSAEVDPGAIMLEEETEAPEESLESDTGMTEDGSFSSGEGTAESTQADGTVTLAKALGHEEDLFITYDGSYISDNYVEGDAYSLDAKKGKTYYIMKFTVTNPTKTDVQLDNLTLNPMFKLVGNEVEVNAEVTFLAKDFSTYLGTIPAGGTVETVILFEIPETQAASISEPELQITVDNKTNKIKL